MRVPPLICTAMAAALLAAGCGGGDGPDEPAGPSGADYGADRAGRTVEEARRTGGTQLVRGSLLTRDGEVRLCTALMESFPPQCAEPSLLVEGLDPVAVAGTTTAEDVTWSEREVSLHGRVDGNVLRVSGG